MEPVSPNVPRVDRLLRSLVGVADLRMVWTPAGVLSDVHILRASGVQQHQLVRNIVSGLKAGFGIQLPGDRVYVHATRALFDAACASVPAVRAESPNSVAAAPAVAAPSPAPAVKPVPKPLLAAVKPAAPEAEKPRARSTRAPELVVTDGATGVSESGIELERIEVERHGPLLRCRVSVRSEGHRYSAIAEAPHSAAAEAELAARVTLDALRAGSLTEAQLDGVGLLTLGETSYVVAAVRESAAATPRASAAPLFDSMAWSAAIAVINTVGQTNDVQVPAPRPALSAG